MVNIIFATVGIIVFLLGLSCFLGFMWRSVTRDYKDAEKECLRKETYINHLEKTNSKLRKEIEIRIDKEKEVNEKLSALHCGGINAALNVLQNR